MNGEKLMVDVFDGYILTKKYLCNAHRDMTRINKGQPEPRILMAFSLDFAFPPTIFYIFTTHLSTVTFFFHVNETKLYIYMYVCMLVWILPLCFINVI